MAVGDSVCSRVRPVESCGSIGRRRPMGIDLPLSCRTSRLRLWGNLRIARNPGTIGGRLVVLWPLDPWDRVGVGVGM